MRSKTDVQLLKEIDAYVDTVAQSATVGMPSRTPGDRLKKIVAKLEAIKAISPTTLRMKFNLTPAREARLRKMVDLEATRPMRKPRALARRSPTRR